MSDDSHETEEIRKFYKAYRTVNEMLIHRGYNVPSEDLNKTFEDFHQEYKEKGSREHFSIYCSHSTNSSNTILVFFPEDLKLGIPTIKKICEIMDNNDVVRGIVVMRVEVTAFARRALERINSSFQLETFKQSELMINITNHTLVPKHEILSDKEKKDLLKQYSLKESQLPRIQKLDPVSRYFGAKPGQVFKIIRKSETAGRYVTYRIVV